MMPSNKATYLEDTEQYVTEVLRSSKIAGDGKYTKLCTWKCTASRRIYTKKRLSDSSRCICGVTESALGEIFTT